MRRFRKKIQKKVTDFGTYSCRSSESTSFANDVFCFVACLALAMVFIFSYTSSAQVSATDTVTQGRTNKQVRIQSRWSSALQWMTQRNQNYYSDYFTALSLGVAYQYTDSLSLFAQGGYSQPVSREYQTVRNFGVNDLQLGVNTTPFYKNKYNFAVAATSSLSLPTSTQSQLSSLNAGWSGGLVTITPLQYNFRVMTSHIAILQSFRYETVNAAGTSYNSPYGVSNNATLVWGYQRYFTTVSYGLANFQDYAGTDIGVQSARMSFGATVYSNIRGELYARWRDRILTDNAMFADDTMNLGLLLTMNL
jgi:hypothetical protein